MFSSPADTSGRHGRSSGHWDLSGDSEDGAAEDVAGDVEAEESRGGLCWDADGLDVEGVHHDEVAVHAMPGGWGGTDESGGAGIVGQLEGALGQTRAGVVTAPSGSSVTPAGMSATAQCQKPEPVGASGSYTVTA